MAVSRGATSSLVQGLPKYRSMLGGNSPYIPTDFESISTATPSGTNTVTFSGIPQTYTHLQLRVKIFAQSTGGAITLRYNNSSTFNYAYQYLQADPSNGFYAGGSAGGVDNYAYIANGTYASTNGMPYVGNIDIQDYASTTRNKTTRTLLAQDTNGGGYTRIRWGSVVQFNTSAITSFTIGLESGGNFMAGTSLALYGIKG